MHQVWPREGASPRTRPWARELRGEHSYPCAGHAVGSRGEIRGVSVQPCERLSTPGSPRDSSLLGRWLARPPAPCFRGGSEVTALFGRSPWWDSHRADADSVLGSNTGQDGVWKPLYTVDSMPSSTRPPP